MQSRHLTHCELSRVFALASIAPALQTRSHIPHETHFDASIPSFTSGRFAASARHAPTGHSLLQNQRPFQTASAATAAAEAMDTTSAEIAGAATSTPMNQYFSCASLHAAPRFARR